MTKRERNILLFVVGSFLVGNFLILYQKLTTSHIQVKSLSTLTTKRIEDTSQKPPARIQKVNINTATFEELIELPGIGKKKAQSIIKMRQKLGKFKSYEDLLEVKGIGPNLLERLKPYIKFD